MNKEQAVSKIAAVAGITKTQAATALDAFCTIVGDTLRSGDKLTLTGFGTFEAKHREARDFTSPANGETIHVAAHSVPHFKAGKGLKDALLK